MTEDKYDVLARQLGKTRADVIESLELYGFAERGEWDEYNERLETNDRELHPNGTREQIERVVHEIVGRKTFESPVAGLEWVLQEHRKQAAELLALRANLDEAIEERAKYAGDWLRQRAELSSYNYDRIAWQRNAEKAETERDEARVETTDAYTLVAGLVDMIRCDAGEESWLKALDLISKKSASTTELVSMDILYTGATECARLRDVLSNLLTGIKAYLADEGREIATLHNYGPADAWFKDAIQAAQREFPLTLPDTSSNGSGHEPDGLTVLSATEPTPEHTVIIPARTEHNGIWATSVRLKWICPVCGGSRGKISEGLSYDGSRRLSVSRWLNPCGHIDAYVDIRKEAAENGMNERAESAASLTPSED